MGNSKTSSISLSLNAFEWFGRSERSTEVVQRWLGLWALSLAAARALLLLHRRLPCAGQEEQAPGQRVFR